jgi:hypothetical protein
MLLDIQNQFREEHVNALKKGEATALPAGYKELYAKWAQVNKEISYKLSAEEITQSFSDFVAKEVNSAIGQIIEATAPDEETKIKFRQLAIRGQLLLVSANGGQSFDQILTPEDLRKVAASHYAILSSTFRATTTNLREVLDEQSLLYVAKKLRAQHFTLQSAWVDEDHKIHVEIVPRGGIREVEVDLARDITKPLVYAFIDKDGGVKEVVETQLPEAFGELEVGTDLEITMPDPAVATDAATNAALAAATAANVANIANQINAENALKAQETAKQQMAGSLLQGVAAGAQVASQLSNVMQAKAEVKARMARQAEKLEGAQEQMAEINLQRDRKQKIQKEKKDEELKITQMQKNNRGGKRFLQGSAAGVGIAGLVGGAATGTTLFVTLFS